MRPGVVIINTALRYNSEQAAGTGMVINSSGLVLTNNHVIDDSTSITVTVPATGRTYPATVLGYDKTGDIALIRVAGRVGAGHGADRQLRGRESRRGGRRPGQRRRTEHHHGGGRAGDRPEPDHHRQ